MPIEDRQDVGVRVHAAAVSTLPLLTYAARDCLPDYVSGFSGNVKDIFDKYEISERFAELDEHDLLFVVPSPEKGRRSRIGVARVPNS